MTKRVLNLVLNGGGLVGKFIVLFFLARILPPDQLGTYGIIVSTLSYVLYIVGFDFYTFAGRAMAQSDRHLWPCMIRDQLVLFSLTYAIVIPLVSLLFWFNLLPKEHILVFFLLLIVEHISLECARALVVIGRPVSSCLLMFVRTGALGYVILTVYLVGVYRINLSTVLWGWFGFDVLALGIGCCFLHRLPWAEINKPINWQWIRKGVRIALLFLVGTLALRGLFTLDRYLIEAFSTREMLGVYTLFLGVSNSIVSLIDASIFSFQYPKLIAIYKSGDTCTFRKAYAKFALQTISGVIILSILAICLIDQALYLIDKPIYLQHISMFYLLLLAVSIFAIGHVPHYALYAMGKDRMIVIANIIGFIFFVLFGSFLAAKYNINGVVIALLIALTMNALLKQLYIAYSGGLKLGVSK